MAIIAMKRSIRKTRNELVFSICHYAIQRNAKIMGVERELTGRETEPWEIMCFKFYKSQVPVIEQAIETAALMLGSDKSRGYCLEMICADFLAGANLDGGNPTVLLQSIARFFELLPGEQRQAFVAQIEQSSENDSHKVPSSRG